MRNPVTEIHLVLNLWPPSLNEYWRSYKGRNILSKKARVFCTKAIEQMRIARTQKLIPLGAVITPVAVDIELWPPDRRSRDIDNYTKGIFDALTKGGVWSDDRLAWDLHLHWARGTVKGGKICITIEPYDYFTHK